MLKKIALPLAIILLATVTSFGQTEITYDASGTKIVKGFLTKKDLVTDTAFKWFATNQAGYVPDASALQAFKLQKDSINIIAFGGTWCGDTKYLLPKFLALADAAGVPENRITIIGVDHSKKTIEHLSEAFNIVNVPTFIIMKNGKEVGRVVEYGHTGVFDRELGEIVKK